MAQLTDEQEARVIQYARAKGKNWKASLAREWHTGKDERCPILRQLRNEFGTTWLARYKLPVEITV